MAKLEDQLAKLNALSCDDDPARKQSITTLSKALSSKNNHVIARAAALVCDFELDELLPRLADAFDRLLPTAHKSDKGGSALTELAKTLTLRQYHDGALFARGSEHIQMEPVYGGKVDVADHLRGWCAQGIAQTGDPDALTYVAKLLADSCVQTRVAAVKAVEVSGRADIGLPLLILKLTQADDEPQVLGQCVSAILDFADTEPLQWIKPLLEHDDLSVVEQVLLAMGQSRDARLGDFLIDFHERRLEPEIQKTALLAMAMLRSETTLEYLEDLVIDGSGRAAEQAIEALGIYHYDMDLKQRLITSCTDRDDRFLLQKVQSIFTQ